MQKVKEKRKSNLHSQSTSLESTSQLSHSDSNFRNSQVQTTLFSPPTKIPNEKVLSILLLFMYFTKLNLHF